MLLKRKLKKTYNNYFYRLLVHSSIDTLKEAYRKEMLCNQKEFVYETDQNKKKFEDIVNYKMLA